MHSQIEQNLHCMQNGENMDPLLPNLNDINARVAGYACGSLLGVALFEGWPRYVPTLLHHRANINAADEYGMAMWPKALRLDELNATKLLLQRMTNQGSDVSNFQFLKDGTHFSWLETLISSLNLQVFEFTLST